MRILSIAIHRHGRKGPHEKEEAAVRTPNAGAWWRYAAACIIFDLGHKSVGRSGYLLRVRVDRRRYSELFKNTRGRAWRPALTYLPMPEKDGSGDASSPQPPRRANLCGSAETPAAASGAAFGEAYNADTFL